MRLGTRRRWPPIHIFVIWSEARHEEHRILQDLAARFTLLDLVEVVWSPGDTFAANLSRMYGDDLPPNSAKELHSGTAPFLAVLVEDRRPRYRPRRTNKGVRILNASVFDARRQYRQWTGGGYRVHASDCVAETRRNVALLFGEQLETFRGRHVTFPTTPRVLRADLAGTNGWTSMTQLLTVLETHGGRGRVDRGDGFALVARDAWWVKQAIGGRERSPDTKEVLVAGDPVNVTVVPSLWGRIDGLLAPLSMCRPTLGRFIRAGLRKLKQAIGAGGNRR